MIPGEDLFYYANRQGSTVPGFGEEAVLLIRFWCDGIGTHTSNEAREMNFVTIWHSCAVAAGRHCFFPGCCIAGQEARLRLCCARPGSSAHLNPVLSSHRALHDLA
jgi:hypothetical protein